MPESMPGDSATRCRPMEVSGGTRPGKLLPNSATGPVPNYNERLEVVLLQNEHPLRARP